MDTHIDIHVCVYIYIYIYIYKSKINIRVMSQFTKTVNIYPLETLWLV